MPALRGAFTFLTRVPVPGAAPADWHAFRRSPWTFPAVGAVVGAVAGFAFLAPSPWTAAAAYLLAIYLLTGVTHADGLADLGDAIAAHDPDRRLAVLKDADLGVGGALALAVTLLATTLGVLALATGFAGGGVLVGGAAFRIVLAAEVGAKAGMATLACLGTPAHEGLGSAVVGEVGPRSLVPVAAVSVPVLLAAPPGALPSLAAALLAGPAVALLLLVRVRPWLGGASGDVLGAANELGRAVALHAGVMAWAIA
ncbi:adenosylcobinamide-GDP ribazoletransferase [Halorubrum halodurans]|uniref:Adenosylcobinamide-GDP ribazoletransferase n=1 Tax=Halorubrum halodurans TaxID=1383851 RepID=A0A256IG18_9EURY|nr:adenosylcobinamide-GDP ribazoletransferase [Halorubrum halodurans]OYR55485.1 adenosylcobinamide-GDP ribazoletransferase [Halorubrum halodurans]